MSKIKSKTTSIMLLIAMLMLSAFVGTQFAATVQAAGYTEYMGAVSGVSFVLRIPDPWNGMLVVVTAPGSTSDPRTSTYNTTSAMLLAKGYAVAASNYGGPTGTAGFPFSKAMNSTPMITRHLVDTYHVAGKVFLYGVSQSGNFAIALGQRNPDLYAGVFDVGGSKDGKSHYAYYDTLANLTIAEIRSYAPIPANWTDGQVNATKNQMPNFLRAYQNETGGTPSQVPQAYEDRSNTYHADIRIPVITIHSAGDVLVPYSQTTMFQAAVEAAGASSLYRVYTYPAFASSSQVPQTELGTHFDELVSWSEQLHPSLRASAFSDVTVMPGWTWWFFAHSTGGVGARTFQWYEGTTLLQGQTSMVLPIMKTAPGTYTFYCKVTDSQGATAYSSPVTLTVLG